MLSTGRWKENLPEMKLALVKWKIFREQQQEYKYINKNISHVYTSWFPLEGGLNVHLEEVLIAFCLF